MTSDNIAEYVGENNQFTEKPVTEYPPVIQDNTVTTKDYLYSNNIDTDLLVVIGGLIVILFLMMLIMYFINSLRHKELTEILTKISFPEKSGSNSLKPEAVSCNLLSLCVLAPVPGISESGEVVDMAAYEAWQQENHPDIQQQMQRREEVNINVHRERGEDVEPGDDF